jgi:hypothetical protein
MSRITPLLLAFVALGGIIAWQSQVLIGPSVDSPPAGPTPRAAMRSPVVDDAATATSGWVASTLERPLFRENRRPAKSAAGVKPGGAARLTGIIVAPSGSRAIFTAAGTAKAIVVGPGGRVDDLVVRSIEPGQAVVEAEGGVRTLKPSTPGRIPPP